MQPLLNVRFLTYHQEWFLALYFFSLRLLNKKEVSFIPIWKLNVWKYINTGKTVLLGSNLFCKMYISYSLTQSYPRANWLIRINSKTLFQNI